MKLASVDLALPAPVRPARPSDHLFRLAVPVGIFLVTRIFAGILIASSSKHQIALGPDTIPGLFIYHPTPADSGYLSIITNWDGQWYESIATDGYQATVAGQPASHDQVWAWAFPPVFPLLVGFLMHVTGLSFAVVSTMVNCAAGAAAMVLLFRLLEEAGGRWVAVSGVTLSCCFVSAPLFQAAYSESLALLFLLAALALIRRRSYWLAILPTTALMFTRIVTPVLFVVVVVAVASRLRAEGRRSLRVGEWGGAVALAGTTIAGAVAWPALAAQLMGEVGRFNRTARMASEFRLGWFGQFWDEVGVGGVLIVVALVMVPVLGAVNRRSEAWGGELRTWSVAYPLFILGLTSVTGGVLRYALLAPTLGLLLVRGSREEAPSRAQVTLVALAACVGLFCQYLFIRHMMVIDSRPLML